MNRGQLTQINGLIYNKSVLCIRFLDLAVSNAGSKPTIVKHRGLNFSSTSIWTVATLMSDSYKDTWEKVWIENISLMISFFPSPSRRLKWCRNWYLLARRLFPGQRGAGSPPRHAGGHAVQHPCPAPCSLAPSCKDEKYWFQSISLKYYHEVFTDMLGLVRPYRNIYPGGSSVLCSKKLQEGEWIYCFRLQSVAWDLTVALAILD